MKSILHFLIIALSLSGLVACVQPPNEQLSKDSILVATLPENLYVGKLVFVSQDKRSAVLELAPGLGSIFFENDRLVARDKNLVPVALLRIVILNRDTIALEVLAGTPTAGLNVVKPSSKFLEEVETKFLTQESK